MAPRPIITASHPVYAFISSIWLGWRTSPLPMTGTGNACFRAAMASQLARPPYFCSLVRPCKATNCAPFSTAMRPISIKLICSSQPKRILAVMGTRRWRLSAAKVSATSAGSRIMPTPAPRPLTCRVEQPMLISMMSGPSSPSIRTAASKILAAELPKIWNVSGYSPGRRSKRVQKRLCLPSKASTGTNSV